MLILTGCLDFVGLCVRARACGVPHGALKKKGQKFVAQIQNECVH